MSRREVIQKYMKDKPLLYKKIQDGHYFWNDMGTDKSSDYMSIDMSDFSIRLCAGKRCNVTEEISKNIISLPFNSIDFKRHEKVLKIFDKIITTDRNIFEEK